LVIREKISSRSQMMQRIPVRNLRSKTLYVIVGHWYPYHKLSVEADTSNAMACSRRVTQRLLVLPLFVLPGLDSKFSNVYCSLIQTQDTGVRLKIWMAMRRMVTTKVSVFHWFETALISTVRYSNLSSEPVVSSCTISVAHPLHRLTSRRTVILLTT
jgi:hypothetical protein